jgi:hypothetical protein
MPCLLGRSHRGQIVEDPFPHLVVREALDRDVYRRLDREFPEAQILLDGRSPVSNCAYRYAAHSSLDDPRISALWREFVAHHVSQAFFARVVDLFGPHLRRMHGGLEERSGKPIADWRSSVRFREPIRDIALECQFAYGAPVEATSRTIGPHVDREVALYAGLFYMRDERDDSRGGDLELYRPNPGHPTFEPGRRRVADEHVALCKTIPYASNTLVFFLHSERALHGVSSRSPTAFPRRHVNLVGELATKVFNITGGDAPAQP